MFWNHSAERLLGHKSDAAIGQKCYEVCQSLPQDGSTPICLEGCPAVRLASKGAVPSVIRVRMLCASGLRKPITVTPLVIPSEEVEDSPLLVHILHDGTDDAEAREVAEEVLRVLPEQIPPSNAQLDLRAGPLLSKDRRLTNRETEILRLVALSFDSKLIAEELHISEHTVLNHIRNARVKLNAANKLNAVLTARRLGLI